MAETLTERPQAPTLERDDRPPMVKVTMNLTDHDEENAHFVQRVTSARSKAQAVSIALSLTRFLFDQIIADPKTNIILRAGDGSELRVAMPELEAARRSALR